MNDPVLAVLTGAGGLALFLYGMLLLSEGLKEAAGDRLHKAIHGIAHHRWRGFALGTVSATAIHSSATTVLVVGFLNAGLLTLAGAMPIIAGANLGTSLAMQFIAFDISWLWSAFAVPGLLLRTLPGGMARHRIGQALLGLALLFLGMKLMSQSVYPFRETLSDWIARDHATSWGGFLNGIGVTLALTAVIQSSGATIGILFSLASAGVFTDISQVMPYLIGAQIGTCATAIAASVGTSAEARRGALGHLAFNMVTAVLSILALPWLYDAVRMLDASLVRQIAHAHMLMMLLGALFVVPASRLFAAALERTLRFRSREQESSHLDESLVTDPPAALLAARRELVRASRIVRRGFALNRSLAATADCATHRLVKQSEAAMDLIYHAMRDFLMRLSAGIQDVTLGSRIQWLNFGLIFLERISDHNDNLADLSIEMSRRLPATDLPYARDLCDHLYRSVEPLLAALEQAWSPENTDDGLAKAKALRDLRALYLPESERLQGELVGRIAKGELKPITGFVLTEYISEMDRIVRHTKKIAGILEKSESTPT